MSDLMIEARNALDVLAVLTETRPGNVRLNALDTLTRALKAAAADARALWAVRVLDAWAESNGGWWQVDTFLTPGLKGWTCEYSAPRDKRGVRSGPTPDAARLAAAEAVYPTLPADVRAKLGARP